MQVKYNRVSTTQQSGERFKSDSNKYDLTLLDKCTGTIPFSERPQAKKLYELIKERKVELLVVEELSRLGRNMADVISTLSTLDMLSVNVKIRNIGIESRPNGKKNPIWSMLSSVLASMYEMELENIKERTRVGREMYVLRGGKLGRPQGTNERQSEFLEKAKSQEITKYLQKGHSIRDTAKIVGVSPATVQKVRKLKVFKF